jgi:cytochrome c oxidase assembly protein subunit 11
MNKAHNSQRKHTVVLLMLAVGMFGFAFALVPLYAKFCELTGLNGKTSEQVAYSGPQIPVDDRVVTIQFLGIVGTGMPWEFRPMEHQLLVRPGTLYTTQFYVRNRASQPVTGQAIPSVSPGLAALHLHKTECFCFTQQQLAGGEEMEMPVTFFIDTDLPEGINTLSLSYTLYRVNPVQTAQVVSN